MQTPARHLAQPDVGRAGAPAEVRRPARGPAAPDRVNGIGKRAPQFIWGMEGPGEPGRGHAPFGERRADGFGVLAEQHVIRWWVPGGHRAKPDEAVERLALRQSAGDGDRAFGRSRLEKARLHRTRQGNPIAAEWRQ